jgi:hypothetical protein
MSLDIMVASRYQLGIPWTVGPVDDSATQRKLVLFASCQGNSEMNDKKQRLFKRLTSSPLWQRGDEVVRSLLEKTWRLVFVIREWK